MLTGKLPLELPEEDSSIFGNRVMAIGRAHQEGLPPLTKHRSDLPSWVVELVASMLSEMLPSDHPMVMRCCDAQSTRGKYDQGLGHPNLKYRLNPTTQSDQLCFTNDGCRGQPKRRPNPKQPNPICDADDGRCTTTKPRIAGCSVTSSVATAANLPDQTDGPSGSELL